MSLAPKETTMLMYFYDRLGLDKVSLTDETVGEIISINANEDADADQLRQRLLNNFYNLKLSVLIARFMVAEAILNTTKVRDRKFRTMLEVRYYVFTAILHWLREHKVTYDSNSLWFELCDLGAWCISKSTPVNKKVSDE